MWIAFPNIRYHQSQHHHTCFPTLGSGNPNIVTLGIIDFPRMDIPSNMLSDSPGSQHRILVIPIWSQSLPNIGSCQSYTGLYCFQYTDNHGSQHWILVIPILSQWIYPLPSIGSCQSHTGLCCFQYADSPGSQHWILVIPIWSQWIYLLPNIGSYRSHTASNILIVLVPNTGFM